MSNHDHCGCGCEHHEHEHKSMDKYMSAINQSNVTIDDAAVTAAVQEIIDKHAAENNTPEVQQFLLDCTITEVGTQSIHSLHGILSLGEKINSLFHFIIVLSVTDLHYNND